MKNSSQDTKREGKICIPISYVIVAAVMLIALGILGRNAWKLYTGALMNNQKDQLLLISQALSDNMEASLSEYEDILQFLCRVEENGQADQKLYDEFLSEQTIFCEVRLEDAEGRLLRSVRGLDVAYEVELAKPNENLSYWQCRDGEDHIGLAIRQRMQNGTVMVLVIDEEEYYQELISNLHVGTNGYIVIKASDGRIVMHPSRLQWGIEVIEGRRKLFPELEYTSLSEMIDKQIEEESGVYEYESYWWTDASLPRVRKVAAHAHVKLGVDFWIVSAVVDYADFFTPVAHVFRSLMFIFSGALLVFLYMAFVIGKLLLEHQKAFHEIQYLQELNETLEELHRSEETLAHQQRLQVMGTMTGGIAHEFNNFLTPIMGHADLLMAEASEDSDIYDSAKEIYEASERAQDIIRQISSMSRKNVETVYRSVSAKELLKRNRKMLNTICPPHIHVEDDIYLQDESFLGNATQIHQVLLNMGSNAVYAIDREEGVITLRGECISCRELEQYRITEKISDVWKEYIHISMKDTGCGMERDTLKHIFEPFFTTKKTGEGTGLGLSLADQIIHAHHGYLTVESEPGRGTIFHIFLPVVESGMELSQLKWGDHQQIQIAIADDNQKILKLLEKQLTKPNIQVHTCSRKEELRNILQNQQIDILAIDESIGDGDGIDFCMSIQEMYPNLLRIVMTDTITKELIEARRHKIIDDYVAKPVSDSMLFAVIHKNMNMK